MSLWKMLRLWWLVFRHDSTITQEAMFWYLGWYDATRGEEPLYNGSDYADEACAEYIHGYRTGLVCRQGEHNG